MFHTLLAPRLSSGTSLRYRSCQKRIASVEAERGVSPFLIDSFQRQHNYLRISLTERCNLRCACSSLSIHWHCPWKYDWAWLGSPNDSYSRQSRFSCDTNFVTFMMISSRSHILRTMLCTVVVRLMTTERTLIDSYSPRRYRRTGSAFLAD